MNYYMENYYLMFDYHQNLSEWDEMIPFERDVYLNILSAKNKEKVRKETEPAPDVAPTFKG